MKLLSLLVVAICICPLTVMANPLTENKHEQWSFELKPLYLWFLTLDGETTLPPSESAPGGSGDFDDSELTSAFSFHFEAGRGEWTVFTDYLYSEYTSNNISISSPPIKGSNELTVHITELGVAYQILDDFWYRLELLGGVRYLHVANKFDFKSDVLGSLSAKENFWDGFGGVRFTGFLTDSLSATVRADVGGGSSDLIWNVAATIDWRYLDWGSVYAGYRVLDYKVSGERLGLNLQAKGPVIGLGFHW